MNVIEVLKWRYAVKKFNPEKKLSNEQLQNILKAVSLSASSYGMQPYKILVISNYELRKKLQKYSNKQPQIVDSSHLLLFAIRTDFNLNYIENTIKYVEKIRSLKKGTLDTYKNKVIDHFHSMNLIERENWQAKQVYLALGTLLTSCACIKVDSCPIEGFSNIDYDNILCLSKHFLKSTVLTAIGLRSEYDYFQKMIKVRQPLTESLLFDSQIKF